MSIVYIKDPTPKTATAVADPSVADPSRQLTLTALRMLVTATGSWPGHAPVEFRLPEDHRLGDEPEFIPVTEVRVPQAPPPATYVGRPATPRVIHRREELVPYHAGTLLRSVKDGHVYKMVTGSSRLISLHAGSYNSVNTDDLLEREPSGLEIIWVAPEPDTTAGGTE